MAYLPGNDKQPHTQVCRVLEVVDVHTDKHIAASNQALDCLMLQLSQLLLLGSGDEVGAS